MAVVQKSQPTASAETGERKLFNRPPRVQPLIVPQDIEVPPPPEVEDEPTNRINFGQIVRMLMTAAPMVIYAILAPTLSGGSGSGAFALIRLLAPIFTIGSTVLLAVWQIDGAEKRKQQREVDKIIKTAVNYRKRIKQVEIELNELYAEQLGIMERVHPPVPELQKRLPSLRLDGSVDYPDSRLWERLPEHTDFLQLRVGTTVLPTPNKVEFPDLLEYALPVEQQGDLENAVKLGEKFQYLVGAPLLIDFRARGAVGIVGANEEKRLALVRAMLMQLVVHHAPNDVSLFIIAPNDSARDADKQRWAWTRYLPHCNEDIDVKRNKQNGDWVATDEDRANLVMSRLLTLLNRRRDYLEAQEGAEAQRQIMVVVDSIDAQWTEHPVFATLLALHTELSLSAVFISPDIMHVPSSATALVRLDLESEDVQLWYGETGEGGVRYPAVGWDIEDTFKSGREPIDPHNQRALDERLQPDAELPPPYASDPNWHLLRSTFKQKIRPDQCDQKTARAVAFDHLQHALLKTAGSESDIPNFVSFLDMYDAVYVEDIDLNKTWFRPIDYSKKLEDKLPFPVRIGKGKPMDTGGGKISDMFLFNLQDQIDGPHGLVAGTTGAGKSELLQTLVAALAIEHHPYYLAFFLIDYKGGSTFSIFQKMPHTLGNVSDLDASQAERALVALKTELRYRKGAFRSVNISNINEYQQIFMEYQEFRKSGKPSPRGIKLPTFMQPIPHLVIIIDEFAELKQELDHFMPEMSRIARVGRSLGIHLVLATQRPSGAVSEEIRANSQFALCLRVKSVADSRDMIRTSDAAYLPNEIRGRAFRQRGNDKIEQFQAAYVGMEYKPEGDAPTQKRSTGFTIFWGASDAQRPAGQYEYSPQRSTNGTGTFTSPRRMTHEMNAVAPETNAPTKGKVVDNLVRHIVDFTASLPDYVAMPQLFQEGLPEEITLGEVIARAETDRLGALIEIGKRATATPDDLRRAAAAAIQIETVREIDEKQPDKPLFKWNWSPAQWELDTPDMRMILGIVDDPANRAQDPLLVDQANALERGHLVIYGSPSTGKTTTLRMALISLMQLHAPWEFQAHLIDFASNSLQDIAKYPHIGNYVKSVETAKCRRLLRWLSAEFAERRLSGARDEDADDDEASSGQMDIYATNRVAVLNGRYDDVKPIIAIAVDNFKEFWETFGDSDEASILIDIAQNGVGIGMFLLATGGDLYRDIPSAIVRSVKHRIAFTMNETDQLQMVVGGRPPYLPTEPPQGRCMWRGSPPLQAQIAQFEGGQEDLTIAFGKVMLEAAKTHRGYAEHRMPHKIGEIPETLMLDNPIMHIEVAPADESAAPMIALPIGQRYDDLQPHILTLNDRTGHVFIAGKQASGKTALLQAFALKAAEQFSPDQLEISIILPNDRSYKAWRPFAALDHVRGIYYTFETFKTDVIDYLTDAYQVRSKDENPVQKRLLVIIDDSIRLFDEKSVGFKPMAGKTETEIAHYAPLFLDEWASRGHSYGIHFAASWEFNASSGVAKPQGFLGTMKNLSSYICVTSWKNASALWVNNVSKLEKRTEKYARTAGRGFVFTEGDDADIVQFPFTESVTTEIDARNQQWSLTAVPTP